MNLLSEYLILSVLIFGMNIIPVLMPPTWVVLLFFYRFYHLSLAPTVIVGAISAISGRIILAHLASLFSPYLQKKSRENLLSLGNYFNSHIQLSIPLFLTYAFMPISSNYVYIAAGLARVNLKLLAVSFFFGRLISYTFWLTVTHGVLLRLDRIFSRHFAKPVTYFAEIAGFIILYLLSRINWKKLIMRLEKYHNRI